MVNVRLKQNRRQQIVHYLNIKRVKFAAVRWLSQKKNNDTEMSVLICSRFPSANYTLFQLIAVNSFTRTLIWLYQFSEKRMPVLCRGTVLVLIKLTKFAVALRLRCGICKLIF